MGPLPTGFARREELCCQSSPERPLEPPAEIAGAKVDSVASAVEPESAAFLVLDLEIVPDRIGLAAPFPPFAMHSLGPVGAADPVDPAAVVRGGVDGGVRLFPGGP